MTRTTIPFVRPAPARPVETPDVAFASLPMLRRLRDALQRAARPAAKRDRWGMPKLFFFNRELQAEWEAVRAETMSDTLTDVADDALTVLSACPQTRRAARAIPGLVEAAQKLNDPRSRELAELLTMPEDEVILAIHPGARAGFRIVTRGVADLAQFHVLLAAAVTGDPARGLLPGARPDPRVVAAYRDESPDPDADVATARFQFFRPSALQPDGTLPSGFTGSDHWLWNREPLSALPRIGDERVVFVGEPAFRETWDVARKLPRVTGELEVKEVLTPAAVEAWIEARTGQPMPLREVVRRAA